MVNTVLFLFFVNIQVRLLPLAPQFPDAIVCALAPILNPAKANVLNQYFHKIFRIKYW